MLHKQTMSQSDNSQVWGRKLNDELKENMKLGGAAESGDTALQSQHCERRFGMKHIHLVSLLAQEVIKVVVSFAACRLIHVFAHLYIQHFIICGCGCLVVIATASRKKELGSTTDIMPT